MLSVIIPANNEERYLAPCLDALLAQTLEPARAGGVEVVLAANACTDRTLEIARAHVPRFADRGWTLVVLDIAEGGKLNALNRADAIARGDMRAYLDADVICAPTLLAGIHAALDVAAPRYASGRMRLARARSWVSRQFGRLWINLPFMRSDIPGNVQGAGLFAVNAAGRARWGRFPDIIADDGYVRLLFAPQERVLVDAEYTWPLAEGFAQLVKVRRRQDAGNTEIAETYPELLANESKPPIARSDYLKLFLGQPVSFVVYISVILAVRFGPQKAAAGWTRGR